MGSPVYIHNSSKNRRSGTTMQKMPARGALLRANTLRETKLGYPWKGCFSNVAEVDRYLSGDEVTCLLCGKPFKTLSRHLDRAHGETTDSYKDRFGIGRTRGLCGVAYAQRLRESALERDFASLSVLSTEQLRRHYEGARKVKQSLARLVAYRTAALVDCDAIRADGRPYRVIANAFGVSPTTIFRIKKRQGLPDANT